jgi:signal transduction histidine kinase
MPATRTPLRADDIAAVSHEVRQPLASVRGLTEMLLGRWAEFSDEDKTDMLTEVRHNAERVGRLIDELLEASRSGTSEPVLRRRETDIAALVARVGRDVRITHPELDLSLECDTGLPPVMVDAFKVEQVLANVLQNACQHGSPAGVRVAVVLQPVLRGDVVRVSVSDNGKGINRGDLRHVTEKFFRGPEGRQSGLGLGLWISKGIVEAHGGELVVSSVPGAGTTLCFTIPLQDGAAAGKLAGK